MRCIINWLAVTNVDLSTCGGTFRLSLGSPRSLVLALE